MTENKLVRKFLSVCKAYIREMNEKVSYDKTNIEARAVNALYGVYLDYSALRRKYTRDDARTALEVFSKYVDQAITVLSELKEEYPELSWRIGKTDMSSALIGRALFISSSKNNIDEIFPEFKYGNGGYFVNVTENLKDNTIKMNENTKITLTVGQLKKLVKESTTDKNYLGWGKYLVQVNKSKEDLEAATNDGYYEIDEVVQQIIEEGSSSDWTKIAKIDNLDEYQLNAKAKRYDKKHPGSFLAGVKLQGDWTYVFWLSNSFKSIDPDCPKVDGHEERPFDE